MKEFNSKECINLKEEFDTFIKNNDLSNYDYMIFDGEKKLVRDVKNIISKFISINS